MGSFMGGVTQMLEFLQQVVPSCTSSRCCVTQHVHWTSSSWSWYVTVSPHLSVLSETWPRRLGGWYFAEYRWRNYLAGMRALRMGDCSGGFLAGSASGCCTGFASLIGH